MNRFENKDLLQNLSNQQNWVLIEKFIEEFSFKVDSTFVCDTVQIKTDGEFRYEFQIKDTKEKCKDFFGEHKKHEFALSFGKKHFTFYIRLCIEKFEEYEDSTYLTVNKTKYKKTPEDRSKREGYISKIKSLEDINELINFIFIECLGQFLESPINIKINDVKSKVQYQKELEIEIKKARLLSKEERLKESTKYKKTAKKNSNKKLLIPKKPICNS